jgi:hypothetical protein
MAKTQKQMINIINKKYPQMNAVPYSDFSGDEDNGNGIWFRQEGEEIDGLQVHDYWNNDLTGRIYHFNTLKVFEDLLVKNGWYSESYDAGTLMAWKI